MKIRGRAFCIFLGLALVLGVLSTGAAERRTIDISLSKKEIREMNAEGFILALTLNIGNSSAASLYLSQYDYRVVVQGIDLFALRTSLEEPILIPGKKATLILLPLKIDYAQLLERVAGLEGSAKVGCYVTGLMQFSDGRKIREKVPFAFSAEFPIYRDLEVVIQPLEIKDLGIGGTEFAFVFTCKNKNGFDLVLRKVRYHVALADKTAAEGSLEGEYPVAAGGEKAFSLPVLLDFFEVGNEFYTILQQPALECTFSGEAEAASIWGDQRISFLKKEQIPVEKKGDGSTQDRAPHPGHDLRHHPHL